MLVESPIDAMSLSALEGTNSKTMLYLSTDGASQIDSKGGMVSENNGQIMSFCHHTSVTNCLTSHPILHVCWRYNLYCGLDDLY
ncbi:MAG: hypothetical protein AAFY63_23090 [Cyanobacteria bacterium J06643_13]